MNRRDFLRKVWIAGAGMAALSRLPKGLENGMPFLLGEMTKGARREASMLMENVGISWGEMNAEYCAALARDAQAICNALKPAIDAIAILGEYEAPRIGGLVFVGPGGDDADDGLSWDTRKLTTGAALAVCTPGEPQDVMVVLGGGEEKWAYVNE